MSKLTKNEKRFLDQRTEGEKALQSIKTSLIVFVLLFAFWVGAFMVSSATFVNDFRAFNSCNHVEDDKFTECYEAAKR